MSSGPIEELALRVESAQRLMLEALNEIAAAQIHTRPAKGEWTAAEVCAHVIEMQVLWMAKVERMALQPDVRRTQADQEARIASVAKHASDDFDTVVRRLRDSNRRALDILRRMGPCHLDSRHGGRFTARESVERLVINHLEEHAAQMLEVQRALFHENRGAERRPSNAPDCYREVNASLSQRASDDG